MCLRYELIKWTCVKWSKHITGLKNFRSGMINTVITILILDNGFEFVYNLVKIYDFGIS